MQEEKLTRLRDATRQFQADKGYFSIALYAIEGSTAVRIAEAGETCGRCSHVMLSTGNIGLVARTGKVHSTRDVSSDPSYKSCFPQVRAEITAPIVRAGQIVGIVDAEMDTSRPLTETDEEDIECFAQQLAPFL